MTTKQIEAAQKKGATVMVLYPNGDCKASVPKQSKSTDSAAKKAPAKKATPAKKSTDSAAKKAPAKKAPAKKSTDSAAKKAPAKKSTDSAAKKAPAAKKTNVKKSAK